MWFTSSTNSQITPACGTISTQNRYYGKFVNKKEKIPAFSIPFIKAFEWLLCSTAWLFGGTGRQPYRRWRRRRPRLRSGGTLSPDWDVLDPPVGGGGGSGRGDWGRRRRTPWLHSPFSAPATTSRSPHIWPPPPPLLKQQPSTHKIPSDHPVLSYPCPQPPLPPPSPPTTPAHNYPSPHPLRHHGMPDT